MPRGRLPTYCSSFVDCPAVEWTLKTVEKWLKLAGKSEWIGFLVGKMKVDGAALMSLRKDDLKAALSSGYGSEDLKSLMDCLRLLRMEQLCYPNKLLYLDYLPLPEESKEKGPRESRNSGHSCQATEPCGVDPCASDSVSRAAIDPASGMGEKKREKRKGSVGRPYSRREVYPGQHSLIRGIRVDSVGCFAGYICQYYTPYKFYITTAKWAKEIRQMEHWLTKNSRSLLRLNRSDLSCGMPCCVHNQDDGRWMRGRYIKTIPDSGILEIECVDHGYVLESLLVNVKRLLDAMADRPPLCLPCKLEGGTNPAHDEHCVRVLEELNFDVFVELRKLHRDRYFVKLYDPHTRERVLQLVPVGIDGRSVSLD